MRTITLGVIGLGNMGRGIARNLVRVGYNVAVWGVAGPALRPFEGKRGATVLKPAEMACEGARMAARAGIRLEDVLAVFNVSNARSYASQDRFPRHILSKKWDGRSRIYNLHKDLGMAVALADPLGADVTLGRETFAFLEKAVALGMQEKDFQPPCLP